MSKIPPEAGKEFATADRLLGREPIKQNKLSKHSKPMKPSKLVFIAQEEFSNIPREMQQYL